jgi:hypothetical protein
MDEIIAKMLEQIRDMIRHAEERASGGGPKLHVLQVQLKLVLETVEAVFPKIAADLAAGTPVRAEDALFLEKLGREVVRLTDEIERVDREGGRKDG